MMDREPQSDVSSIGQLHCQYPTGRGRREMVGLALRTVLAVGMLNLLTGCSIRGPRGELRMLADYNSFRAPSLSFEQLSHWPYRARDVRYYHWMYHKQALPPEPPPTPPDVKTVAAENVVPEPQPENMPLPDSVPLHENMPLHETVSPAQSVPRREQPIAEPATKATETWSPRPSVAPMRSLPLQPAPPAEDDPVPPVPEPTSHWNRRWDREENTVLPVALPPPAIRSLRDDSATSRSAGKRGGILTGM